MNRLILGMLCAGALAMMTHAAAPGPGVAGTFASIPAGSVVNLTAEGELDWVHWGLFTESSVDRKASVVPQISNFTLVDASNGFAYVYQFADNANGYSWFDGTPHGTVTNTTTGVWAYGTPQIGSGFRITAPADTTSRTLKVYVGAYAARGKLEAFLSDGSAAGYTNTSLFNLTSGPSGAYTLNYSAASAGQLLTVRWTLTTAFRSDGNVTLQSATLTSMLANNPPYVAITNPPSNAKFAAGSTVTIQAAASDLDGNVSVVEFYANDGKIGEDTTSPYSFAWNPPAGVYALTTRATDNQGGSSLSGPVEIFVHGTGGSLAGSRTAAPSTANLTTEGTADWAHWGLATNNWFNHKASVPQQISDFTKIGTNSAERFSDNYTSFSWSDGTPTASVAGTNVGVFTTGITNGFEITVPADTNSRTLKVYVGLYGAQGNFQAWLSDFSAPAYTDTTLSNYYGSSYAVYTVTYSAASAGKTLTVRYRSQQLFDQDFGNVTLQAATLVSSNTPANTPPTVQVISPTNGAVFTAPASFTFSASAIDADGSISQVEFFRGTTSLGTDASNPYEVAMNSLAAGTYTLSAVATDNSGAKATNAVSIVVNAPPTASITSPTNNSSFGAPATITISANASDADGSVAKVEFYSAATKLGEDATSPYSFTWSNVTSGTYSLTVRAIDNRGALGTSAPVSITVTSLPPQAVTIFGLASSDSGLQFSFATQLGRSYSVERTTALPSTNWQTFTNFTGTGTNATVHDARTLPIQFYRVGAQ